MNRNYRLLIVIFVLVALSIFLVLPSTGINLGTFVRAAQTPLGLDLQGGLSVILQADVPAGQTVDPLAMQATLDILNQRANALGVSGNDLQLAGNNMILGEFPGVTDTSQVIASLGQKGQLAFLPLGSTPLQEGSKVLVDYTKTWTAAAPSGLATPTAEPTSSATAAAGAVATLAAGTTPTVAPTSAPATVYYPLMTGTALVGSSIQVTADSLGKLQIAFALNSTTQNDYKKIFSDYTTAHVGEYLAIALDGVIVSSPSIQNPITDGSGVINGSFTRDAANALAADLRYGALPVPVKVIESRAVGASLGQDSINKSVIAGIIGLLLVIVLMIYNYRLPGFLAVLALAVYSLLNFTLFKLIPVTLTLPGIAGFVLSIGMAVDANILIFERLKEELRAGRALHSGIDLAWRRAWPSIRDSNISTLITCAILFILGGAFGASFVKGFAINLALGVLISLFTAITVTRTFLHVVLDSMKFAEHPRWFGI
jgi:preprotein translocase subunit SecD